MDTVWILLLICSFWWWVSHAAVVLPVHVHGGPAAGAAGERRWILDSLILCLIVAGLPMGRFAMGRGLEVDWVFALDAGGVVAVGDSRRNRAGAITRHLGGPGSVIRMLRPLPPRAIVQRRGGSDAFSTTNEGGAFL